MRAHRAVIRFVGAVAELSAIEFLIAEIIAEVSSLRKKMSHIREFHGAARAAKMTPERWTEIAQRAPARRWGK
jgi:hypothetical protein